MSNQEIHVCIDKFTGPDPYAKAGQKRDPSQPIALFTQSKWEPGKVLKIKFMEGDPTIISKVKEKFALWLPYVKTVKFEYVDSGNADVRIAFKKGAGSWSAGLGNMILDVPQNQPTMNFGWFDSNTKDEEIERVAVHEMGHTLGFIHEQSQPLSTVDWNEEAVYKWFEETQGWPKDETFHNVIQRYSKQVTQYTEYDPTSIMHYYIPAQLLKSGQEISGGNKLSELDKQFATSIYGQKD